MQVHDPTYAIVVCMIVVQLSPVMQMKTINADREIDLKL
jgi:hypothetical protein